MNRYKWRRRRTIQGAATILLFLFGFGWLVAGWRAYVSGPEGQTLAPYTFIGVACVSLAFNIVGDWPGVVSKVSRPVIVTYFASLVGLVAASGMSLVSANAAARLAVPLIALIHTTAWWALGWQRRRPTAR